MTKPSSTPPRLCPTCGTRVGELATKCIVCGAELGTSADDTKPLRPRRSILPQRPAFLQSTKIPPAQTSPAPTTSPTTPAPMPKPLRAESSGPVRGTISLPMPVAVSLIAIFVLMSLILIMGATGLLPLGGLFGTSTPTVAPRTFVPPTFTPPPTPTETPAPTPTPLPPIAHRVVPGDTCISIAVRYNVTVQAILETNGLSAACPIFVGQQLSVPQPTPTPTPPASNTPSVESLTKTAQPRTTYTVAAGDTLFSVSARFNNIDPNAIAKENGLVPPYTLKVGQKLVIPLDAPKASSGPTQTSTPAPYPAPSLLSPANGAAISAVEQNVILQWASVDVLQQNEAYLVTLEDVTCNCAKRKQEVTTTTRYIVNVEMKPTDGNPHVFKWTVVTVRRKGTGPNNSPIYDPAGATSEERTFSWTGIGGVAPAPTKSP